MDIKLEKYNPEKHNEHTVATLIYSADTELMSYLFGSQEEAVRLIVKLMNMKNNYFTHPHIDCAIYKNEIIGVISGFCGKQKCALNKSTGKDMFKLLGIWAFLKKLPIFIKMAKIESNKIDDGYYINTFCVNSSYRSCGVGEQMLKIMIEKYKKVYLDVNIYNHKALKFYQKFGFQIQSKNIITLKKKKIGTYSMKFVDFEK